MLTLSPSCFAFCAHNLSPRIAIDISLVPSVRNLSIVYSSIWLISSNTSRSSLYNSHFPQREFYSLLLCRKGTSVHLLVPHPDYWYTRTPFLFLVGTGLLHEIVVSAFSRSPLGPCKYVFIPISSLKSPVYLQKFFSFHTIF